MPTHPQIIRSLATLRKTITALRQNNRTVGFVPTMGSLHEGHLSLVKLAKKKCDCALVSIFVNPTQFAEGEDFTTYPRDEKEDLTKLTKVNTDFVYMPNVKQMYPEDFASTVSVSGLTDVLCGASRPEHFNGVATIVTKLLLQVLPDLAIFGEKDYQQFLVIKRLTQDLNIPVKISGGTLLREPDGLALSSRNAYLSQTEREAAPKLYETLIELRKKLYGHKPIPSSLVAAKRKLKLCGFNLDYLEIRDAKSLELYKTKIDRPARIFAAAYLGTTRLIDNIPIKSSS
ncbi:MAG: pantoate--beta-alanine ligase [Pseudomonadota bacterium]